MTFTLRHLRAEAVVIGILGLSSAILAQQPIVFTGMCDASAAAAIDGERFVVADDEDNILRVYSRNGGAPLSELDLSGFLGVQGKKKSKETDLEAAAQVGARTFWITSHGRNSKGELKPERHRFFATETRIEDGRAKIMPVGQPYGKLLDDLLREPQLARYGLAAASKLAPKEPGGLNIEGLAATPEGHLLVAFRNPVPAGRALVVPLLNPSDVCIGKASRFGAPLELDLEGFGIRSIERCVDRYLIIAGASGEGGGPSQIFEWDGKSKPTRVPGVRLKGLNPEGVAFEEGGRGQYLVLSDDGTREVDGQDCKDLKDPNQKRFRGRLLTF